MFTGIVQATGQVTIAAARDGDLRLGIDVTSLARRVKAEQLAVGESIAVNGVCLTIVQFDGRSVSADVSRETLDLTTLGRLQPGNVVHLEAALRVGDPLGGHLMSGHVDGVAEVIGLHEQARSLRVTVRAPAALARFIAPKGSVALDGVSLTVNEAGDRQFGVNLIPHTVAQTTFGSLVPGAQLNLEVDLLARYVQRALQE